MSPLTTTCPHCQKVFQIKAEMQGKQCRCANCQTKFAIKANTATKQSENPPKEVEVVAVERAPASQAMKPSDAFAEPEIISAETVDHAAERTISTFEELADKLVSARTEASNKSAYDPRKFLAYSTNANMVSRDSAIERSTRLVIHGAAMMLLALMLLPFVFLGIHLTGWAWTCPLGGLLAAFVGCIGALLTTFALVRRNASSAVIFGVAPGALFFMTGGLIIFLLLNSYWGSPTNPKRTRVRNSSTIQSPMENRGLNQQFTPSSSRRFRNR